MRTRTSTYLAIGVATLLCGALTAARAQAPATLTIDIADYLAAPITGRPETTTLARINFLRPEPGTSGRWFVDDLNGPLYIVEPSTKTFTKYLDFNGRDDAPGLFDRLNFAQGFAAGLTTFQFDPEYLTNGRFYTVHQEEPAVPGSLVPDNKAVAGLVVKGYVPTPPVPTPGPTNRESVIVEWTDTNIRNATFEGTARELLRIPMNTQIHPVGDLIFNPTVRRGDPDWRVMYIGSGDGGSGERPDPLVRHNPQRLDTLVGKILRIVPDLSHMTGTSTVSANGRYRVPNDNPFVKVAGARGEIWAYGLRNPHRLTWEVDPARPANNRLIAMSIGLRTWETINIIRKGANYGYSEREGNEQLFPTGLLGPLPTPDLVPVRISETVTNGTVAPTYPVLQYKHPDGYAILGGFVYRGTRLPALRGKFIFGDIRTGELWWADYEQMLAADDGNPATLADRHEIVVRWNNPNDAPDAGLQAFPTVVPIVSASRDARLAAAPPPAGAKSPAGASRADIRIAVDSSGELYILTKGDGMIRSVVAAAEGIRTPTAPASLHGADSVYVEAPAPLTPDERRRFDAGAEVYKSFCVACHMADGRGSENVAPTLIGSIFALAPDAVTARIVINGKEGGVGIMPALGRLLTDDQIAAALTYVRRQWGQTGTPVTPDSVKAVRAMSGDRLRPWTGPELLALVGR